MSPDSISRLSVSRPRAHILPYHAANNGSAILPAPVSLISVVTSTPRRLPSPMNTSVATNGAFGVVPGDHRPEWRVVLGDDRGVVLDRRPHMRTTACRVDPTPCGGGEVQCSCTSPGNQVPSLDIGQHGEDIPDRAGGW